MKVSVILGENDQILACTPIGKMRGLQNEQIETNVEPHPGQKVYELDVDEGLFDKDPTEITHYIQEMMSKKKNN